MSQENIAGYICVFGNIEEPNISKLEFTRSIKQSLYNINSNFYRNPYYCYGYCETNNIDDSNLYIGKIIDLLDSSKRCNPKKDIFYFSPNILYSIMKFATLLTDTTDRIFLVEDGSAKIDNDFRSTYQSGQGQESHDLELDKQWAVKFLEEEEFRVNDICYYSTPEQGTVNCAFKIPTSEITSRISLIANDTKNKTLYLINIPANFIKLSQVLPKISPDGLFYVDLLIELYSGNFTDLNSKNRALKFDRLVYSYSYGKNFNSTIEEDDNNEDEDYSDIDVYDLDDEDEDLEYNDEDEDGDESQGGFVHFRLSENLNIIHCIPVSYEYENIEHLVDSFSDLVEELIEIYLRIDADKIIEIANDNSKIETYTSCITTNKDTLRNPIKVGKSEIFFDGDLDSKDAINFVKWLGDKINFDQSTFYYKVVLTY